MLGALLERCGDREHLVTRSGRGRRESGGGDHVRYHRLAFGEGAGFIEHQCVDAAGGFQRGRVADQHAGARAHAAAHHDRGGCGEPQRARAGDHQHRHRVDGGGGEVAAEPPPTDPGDDGNRDHHRHKHAGNDVRQTLNRCLGTLRVFHQPHNGGERGLLADAGGRAAQQPLLIDRAGIHARAGALRRRQTFAREQRFIYRRFAVQHRTIHRHAVTGPHDKDVARLHIGNVDVDAFAVALHRRGLGLQAHQFFNRGRRFGARAHFQHFTEQHQGDYRGTGLKIHVMRQRPDHYGRAVDIGHGGAERDQHVHVGAAAAQRVPRAHIKALADPELHWRGERQL